MFLQCRPGHRRRGGTVKTFAGARVSIEQGRLGLLPQRHWRSGPEQIAASEAVLAKVSHESWLIRNSYLLNLLYERYQVWRHPYARNYAAYVRDMYAGAPWDRQKERLRAFRNAVESNGESSPWLPFPCSMRSDRTTLRSGAPNAQSILGRSDVPHLDLLPVFEHLPAAQLVVNPYDAHPNEYANRLAADAVEKHLFSRAGD